MGVQDKPYQQALLAGRVVWAVLFLIQVLIVAWAVAAQTNQQAKTPHPFNRQPTDALGWGNGHRVPADTGRHDVGRWFFNITPVLAVVAIPLGYHARSQTYKRYWQGNQIAPRGYLAGNMILWCCCAGVVGLIHAVASGGFWLATVAAVVFVHLINFPNGRAMEPAVPIFGLSS